MRRMLMFDHLGNPKGEISDNDVFSLRRYEEINGEHSLEITTTQVLDKYDRIIYQDGRGTWREYVITGVDEEHAGGKRIIGTYYCVWSIQSDMSGVIVSKMPGVQNPVLASAALGDILSEQSRWAKGAVTQTTTGGASMYDTTAWNAFGTLLEVWGGELSTTIGVDLKGVVSREVDLYDKQGNQTARRRFDFGADLESVKRTYSDDPFYCRVSPRGKGEETEGGGHGRKIRIDSVNDGKDYLEYAPMVNVAKLPNGNGGWQYPTLIIENSDCETPQELKDWALSVYEDVLTPKITYEVDVLQAGVEGVDVTGVSLGDSVQIVDRKFPGGLRLTGRVVSLDVDELDEHNVKVKIGYLDKNISDKLSNLSRIATTAYETSSGLAQTLSTAAYIDSLLNRINAEINATGGYTYITQGEGIRTYDVAVSDPLVGEEANQVVEIKGGSIRIANSRTAQGEWDWKSVFVSGHILSDLVTAAKITSGYIGSPSGNYWNLDTGEFNIGIGTVIGGGDTTMGDLVDNAISDVDVEYAQNQSQTAAPTSGWQTQAPSYLAGYYIWTRTKTVGIDGSVTYSEPVCISGRDGQTGTNAAAVYLYKRSTNAPVLDVADQLTYTFSTGILTGSIGTWSRGVPSGTETCWVVMATAVSNDSSDVIAKAEWSDPVALTSAGVDGLSQATVFLFCRKKGWEWDFSGGNGELKAPNAEVFRVSGTTAIIDGFVNGTMLELNNAPTKPVVPTTYTFASGELYPVPAGWSRTVPSGDDQCWVVTASAISSSATDIIEPGEWSDAAMLVGESGAVASVQYAVSDSGASAPSSGWQTSIPTPAQGQWLWCRTNYANGSTADTCSYVGTDGEDGTSVYVQSVEKSDGITIVKLVDTDGMVSTLRIADGEDGENGTPGANGYVHVAWANSADGTADFSTTDSANKKYLGVYTDNTEADSTDPSSYNWSRITGANGINQTMLLLYKRSESKPDRPTGTLVYTFSTHTLSGDLAGWSQTLPSGTSPCWITGATASSETDTDTIGGEWSEPVPLSQNGRDGTDGINQATVFIYRRAYGWRVKGTELLAPNANVYSVSGTTATMSTATVSGTTLAIPQVIPSKPSASATYTFETGRLNPMPSGWSNTIPSGNAPCWVTTAAAISTAATDTIVPSEWADVVILAEDGKDGEKGDKGEDGISITAIVEQYARNNSPTTVPGASSWGTAVLTPTESAQYVWNREIVQFSNGSHGSPTQAHVIAIYGKGVKSTTNYYTISNSTTAPSSGYTTTPQIPTKANPYLWNYEVTEYTDGTQYETTKHIVGAYGDEGRGVRSIVEQYYLSTSSSTQTGGEWSTAQPTWSAGHYIWTRSVITWTDSTTTTTTPVLAKAINGANSTANTAKQTADTVKTQFDVLNTQDGIFNKLTKNGTVQGLLKDSAGNLYINASYIQSGILNADLIRSGTMSANRISGGTLTVGGSSNGNGIILVEDASGNTIGRLDKDGASIQGALVTKYKFIAISGGSTDTFTSEATSSSSVSLNSQKRLFDGARGSKQTVVSTRVVTTGGGGVDGPALHLMPFRTYDNAPWGGSPQGYYGAIAAEDGLSLVSCMKSTGCGLYLGSNSVQLAVGDSNKSAANNVASITKSQVNLGYYNNVSHSVGLYMTGSLSVIGSKSRIADTTHYSDRQLYAYETPAPYFGDIGSATTDESGECVVMIDDIFGETARTDMGYQVFLQACGNGSVYVAGKSLTHFIVRGTPGLEFDWEVKAHQRDYEMTRTECHSFDMSIDSESEYGEGIEDAYSDDYAYVEQLERIQYGELEAA